MHPARLSLIENRDNTTFLCYTTLSGLSTQVILTFNSPPLFDNFSKALFIFYIIDRT